MMPSPLTSSFASAAANNGQDGRRPDGSGDWSRHRVNGATQTFRRPSLATNTSSTKESNPFSQSSATPTSGVYVPPHLNAHHQTNGSIGEARYTKDQMLAVYKQQRDAGVLDQNLTTLFTGGWNPREPRESNPSAWGRKDDAKDQGVPGPEVCWNHNAVLEPLAWTEMGDQERELFSSSVNSPIKPPQGAKDGAGSLAQGRKSSVSQSHLGAINTASPGSGRPGVRRREPSDSYTLSNPMSPTGGGRFFRDEAIAATPPVALLRRKTDFKDGSSEPKPDVKDKDVGNGGREETDASFGSLKRSTTNPTSAALNVSTSPWTTPSSGAGFGFMGGSFGSFAMGPSSAAAEGPEPRSSFGNIRGESRFKSLLPKTSSEEISSTTREKSSISNLGKLAEIENDDNTMQSWDESLRNRPGRSDTNPYGDDMPRTHSAARDSGEAIEQNRAVAFGMSGNPMTNPDFMPSMNSDPRFHQTPHARPRGNEPMSPTDTNPYQSPEAERRGDTEQGAENAHMQRANYAFGSREDLRRGVASNLDDRSQTSSAGPSRGFGGLGGLGGFPGFASSAWSASGGTPNPSKERISLTGGLGDTVFGMNDLQSPNMGGLGGSSFLGSPIGQGPATATRSKMSSFFPSVSQDHARRENTGMEGQDRNADFATRSRGISGLDSAFGRREQDNLRGGSGGSGLFGEMSNQDPNSRNLPGMDDPPFRDGLGAFGHPLGFGTSQAPITSPSGAHPSNTTASAEVSGPPQPSDTPTSSQLPAAQQRQMVMPDRMRWIYRDPSGATQGPWSGLEMHDWFKAGFFTAELQVKKLEDTEYEPLAQLVRRIGNSREPFLVPQIGVPHGAPGPAPGNLWAAQGGLGIPSAGPGQPGATQPPFASSFPSFGTTLTAEQQNALERRKQEEQYLMARQKEHLAQQQVLLKQMQLQGGPHSLHSLQHHSSAHSLHSQPSFGSITSPSGYQPSPIQGPIQPPQGGPGFVDGSMRPGQGSQFGADFRGNREDELPALMDRMNVGRGGPFPFAGGPFGQQDNMQPPPQMNQMMQDRARLQMEQQQADSESQGDAFQEGQAFDDRLREFNALRAQTDDEEAISLQRDRMTAPSPGPPGQRPLEQQVRREAQRQPDNTPRQSATTENLSLTQQVQKTAAGISQQQGEASWNRVDPGLPAFLPPPMPTASPLPAPAAQRSRQNVADNLVPESRSQTETPVDTPSASIAPWAEKTSENTKGPSLKEIQEAESRKAAQREEVAAAARRAQAEQERHTQVVPPAPGLPSTSTWANSANTPSTPTNPGINAWAKTAGKPAAVSAAAPGKKTLAQIQKEEEARKQRQAAAQVANQQNAAVSGAPAGKRYADLASKVAAVPAAPSPPTGAWTTVGSGGKAKAPSTIVATPQAGARATSGTTPATAATARTRPSVQTKPSAPIANNNKSAEEFTKWAKGALGKGLNGNINVDEFIQSLLLLPTDTEIISDSIYANSTTLDGRRFADEFVRRRKAADKESGPVSGAAVTAGSVGLGTSITSATTPGTATGDDSAGGKSAGSGWSEVAKKGGSAGQKGDEGANAAFKVVAAKKKGRR